MTEELCAQLFFLCLCFILYVQVGSFTHTASHNTINTPLTMQNVTVPEVV